MTTNTPTPTKDRRRALRDLIKKPAQVARTLNVSETTVRTWIELNAIPPRRVIAVANALDMELPHLMWFAQKATKPVKILRKTPDDLEALLAAYEGRPYVSGLPEASVRMTLARWGERFPLLYQTLMALDRGETTMSEAAKALGITKSALSNIRSRYGMAPGAVKAAPKPVSTREIVGKAIQTLIYDVIAGRKTAREAAQSSGGSLRTFHRHLESVLRPQTLNEISHWSPAFRYALAHEVASGGERHTVKWRKWCEERNLLLKKKVKYPQGSPNWRNEPMKRLLVAYLTGEMTLEELAAARGGEASVIRGAFKKELEAMGMPAMELSIHHQAAVAEVVLARESLFRTGVSGA